MHVDDYKRLRATRFLFIVAATVLWCCCDGIAASAEPTAPTSAAAKDVFFLIPHTHWEGAVFKTREEYLDMGLPNILRALRLLKAYPNYRFVLDQACYVKPFLERYPEEEAAFRKFVAEGRLAIVGGTDVMPDVNMPGGESFVRQMLYGKGYFRKKLGVDVTVGWQLDTFGHHPQMPQLMKLGGYKSFWIVRGMKDGNTPSEFLWEGIDGSRIPAFWYSYGEGYGSPTTLPGFTQFMKDRFKGGVAHGEHGAHPRHVGGSAVGGHRRSDLGNAGPQGPKIGLATTRTSRPSPKARTCCPGQSHLRCLPPQDRWEVCHSHGPLTLSTLRPATSFMR